MGRELALYQVSADKGLGASLDVPMELLGCTQITLCMPCAQVWAASLPGCRGFCHAGPVTAC